MMGRKIAARRPGPSPARIKVGASDHADKQQYQHQAERHAQQPQKNRHRFTPCPNRYDRITRKMDRCSINFQIDPP